MDDGTVLATDSYRSEVLRTIDARAKTKIGSGDIPDSCCLADVIVFAPVIASVDGTDWRTTSNCRRCQIISNDYLNEFVQLNNKYRRRVLEALDQDHETLLMMLLEISGFDSRFQKPMIRNPGHGQIKNHGRRSLARNLLNLLILWHWPNCFYY